MKPIRQDGPDLLLDLKVVPGASRDEIAGVLGDRLKVRISAPPEGGKANRSICELLAKRLGVRKNRVTVEAGRTSAEKTVRIGGVGPEAARRLVSSG